MPNFCLGGWAQLEPGNLVNEPNKNKQTNEQTHTIYIVLDISVCCIAVYFCELCSTVTSHQGESK